MRRLLTLAFLMVGAAAHAHHSRSHYADEVIEVEGDLVAVHWVNPHIGFTVDIADENGEVERWRIEGLSNLGGMRRAGSPAERFTLGERVRLPYLGMNSSDAAKLGLKNGNRIILKVDAIEHELPVEVIESLPKGMLALPVGLPECPVIALPTSGSIRKVGAS